MEGNNSSEEEENPQTMKPDEFEFFVNEEERESGAEPVLTRRTDGLGNDSPDFREEGIELLAEFGRADPSCEVTLVGFQQISAS